MKLEIVLNKGNISVLLKKNQKLVDEIVLKGKNNLSNILLTSMDCLIKRNNLSMNQIKNILVKSDLPDSYTSARIAKSVAKSFIFSKKPI